MKLLKVVAATMTAVMLTTSCGILGLGSTKKSKGVGLGAAILAASSAGAYPNLSEAARSFSQQVPVECDSEAAAYYEKKFAVYREWALA